MRKVAFVCQRGLETFIEPIVAELENDDTEKYQVRRYYVQTNSEIIAAVKWADIVFLEWANEVAVAATQVYDIKKKGVIVRLHSYEALSDRPELIDWTRVNHLLFVAPHILDIVRSKIPNIEKQVLTHICPNGLDMHRITENKKLCLLDIAYVCAISHKKNPAMALQIMAELVKYNDQFILHIAGKIDEERFKIYMDHMITEMGLEDNVIFYDHVKDMDAFYRGKGILLSTSIHEGHPLNVMEGAARGLRPVVHNFKGAKGLYPESWVYNTVSEAATAITRTDIDLNVTDNPLAYRAYVIDKGWTRYAEMERIKGYIDAIELDKDFQPVAISVTSEDNLGADLNDAGAQPVPTGRIEYSADDNEIIFHAGPEETEPATEVPGDAT